MLILFFDILVVLFNLFLLASLLIYYSCKIFYNMEPDSAKYLRTERKPGSIDVHPNVDAIVLNYELDVHILASENKPLHGEKKMLKRFIELPLLNSRTDCHALAREVINQCDLIHHSRLAEVEQVIYYLKKRKLQGGKSSGTIEVEKAEKTEVANFNKLPTYIDMLYEDLSEKTKGAFFIQYLARDIENLEALSKNETLISALARVLREDWKTSLTLTTHLTFTFFCFSMYSCFHEVILKCKVGSLCMDIIDFELRRYDHFKADIEGVEAPTSAPIVQRTCPSSASMSEIPRRIPERVRPNSAVFNNDTNFKAMMEGSMLNELTTSTESIDEKPMSKEDKMKRFRAVTRKQEYLLRVAFYLLLNLAEDESVEEKMTKRNIVGLLVKALERDNDELLSLVVTFLKKLSIMQCNKEVMLELNITSKLGRLLEYNNANLVHVTLKLIFNLSFDSRLRFKIVKAGLWPKILGFLSDDRHQEIVLKLLYQLSYEDEVKSLFSDFVGLIMDMLLLNVGNEGDKLMVALGINLSTESSCAQQIIKQNRLSSLMTRAFTFQDAMLMKMLRNVSEHSSTAPSFIEFVGDIAKAVVESKDENFVRECIGILSNMHLLDLDWVEIFNHFNMVNWIKDTIRSNNSDPELVLQVVVLLGTAASDEACSNLLCKTQIVVDLIDLLKKHQEDDEIVLQIVYAFYVILSFNSDYVISETEAPAYLIDLLQDNNKSIRKLSNSCLYMIAEHSRSWADRIRIEKFRHHNAQWLQMVDSQQLEPEEEEEEDVLPPYLNSEYLSTAIVPSLKEIDDTQDLKKSEEGSDLKVNSLEMSNESLANYGI